MSHQAFTCPQCAKGFSRKGDRDTHARCQHAEQPQFVCGELPAHNGKGCGEAFRRRDALKPHRRTQECQKRQLMIDYQSLEESPGSSGGTGSPGLDSNEVQECDSNQTMPGISHFSLEFCCLSLLNHRSLHDGIEQSSRTTRFCSPISFYVFASHPD